MPFQFVDVLCANSNVRSLAAEKQKVAQMLFAVTSRDPYTSNLMTPPVMEATSELWRRSSGE